MPALLDRKTNADGAASDDAALLLVGDPAWHREGTVVPRGDPAETDLDRALEISGAGFEVAKQAHFIRVVEEVPIATRRFLGAFSGRGHPETRTTYVESGDSFSVVRLDRNEVVGTVGARWTPLQTRDAFGPIRSALDSGLATIETLGSLRGGKQVWMLVRFLRDEIFRRAYALTDGGHEAERQLLDFFGEILPFGLFFNDHSGGSKARVKETGIRGVCANTLDAALAEDVSYDVEVAHDGRVVENYAAATEGIFDAMSERYLALSNYRTLFRDTRLDGKAFDYLVLDPIAPVVHLERKISRREANPHTHAALARKSAIRSRVRDLYEGEGAGIDGEPTAWNAWNAAIEFIDHDVEALPSGSSRIQSLVDGSLATAKRQSFRNLLDYATIEEPDERAAFVAAARGN